jgi:hypothetical protein
MICADRTIAQTFRHGFIYLKAMGELSHVGVLYSYPYQCILRGGATMFDGTCEIRRALIRGDGRAMLDLKADNGTFDWNWFLSSTKNANAVLAVALTALATNKKVWCTINDPVQAWAEVVNFGLAK